MNHTCITMLKGRFDKKSLADRKIIRSELSSAVRDLHEEIDRTPKLRWIKRMKMRSRIGGLLYALHGCLDPAEVWAESMEQEIAYRSPVEAILGIIETKENEGE